MIFSMLVSSGLGSFLSRRLVGQDEGRLIKVLGLRGAADGAAGAGVVEPALRLWSGCRWLLKMAHDGGC